MKVLEKQDSSLSLKGKDLERNLLARDIIFILSTSDSAMTIDEIRSKFESQAKTDFALERAIAESNEIKKTNIGEVMDRYKLKKISFNAHRRTRLFYLNEAHLRNFAKKSRHYSHSS